jgi:hypothetical protein
MGDVTPRKLYSRERDPIPIVQEAGWAPRLVWTCAEDFTPSWDSIPGPSSPYRVVVPTALSRHIDDDDGDEIRYVSRN